MDKLLISGNGKGNSAIYVWSFVYLLVVLICGIVMNYTSTQMTTSSFTVIGYREYQNPQAIFFYYGALITIICCIIVLPIFISCIRKTQINVYENYIEGIGVGQYFLWGDLRTKCFKLAYNQITSFDATGNAIAIHASGIQYNCYVSNASEIQGVIFNQKQTLTRNIGVQK